MSQLLGNERVPCLSERGPTYHVGNTTNLHAPGCNVVIIERLYFCQRLYTLSSRDAIIVLYRMRISFQVSLFSFTPISRYIFDDFSNFGFSNAPILKDFFVSVSQNLLHYSQHLCTAFDLFAKLSDVSDVLIKEMQDIFNT